MQQVVKPGIGLGHFGQLSKVGADMAFKPPIVINTRDRILVLPEQGTDPIDESGLIQCCGLHRFADPFFGGGHVIVVPGFISAFVRRGLIQPRRNDPAFQP